MSGKFTPAALTSIRTCPPAGFGEGTSSTRRPDGPVSSWTRTARMPRIVTVMRSGPGNRRRRDDAVRGRARDRDEARATTATPAAAVDLDEGVVVATLRGGRATERARAAIARRTETPERTHGTRLPGPAAHP